MIGLFSHISTRPSHRAGLGAPQRDLAYAPVAWRLWAAALLRHRQCRQERKRAAWFSATVNRTTIPRVSRVGVQCLNASTGSWRRLAPPSPGELHAAACGGAAIGTPDKAVLHIDRVGVATRYWTSTGCGEGLMRTRLPPHLPPRRRSTACSSQSWQVVLGLRSPRGAASAPA